MDLEQEDMQILGFFGVCREAFKIINSWRKVFGQITLTLVLPLSFILLAHMEVSEVLSSKITHNMMLMNETKAGTPKYEKLSDVIKSEVSTLRLFKAVYHIFSIIFSLLSTAGVVYTIASIYTGREVTFKKVMSVVPKVWKRLMLTFLCNFIAYFAYTMVAALIIIVCVLSFLQNKNHVLPLLLILVIFYLVGLVYMAIVWQLANVVTVLEDTSGFQAMRKSRVLLKGNMWVATFISLMLGFCQFAILVSFQMLIVVRDGSLGTARKFGYGIICLVLLSMLLLFGLVLQTVLYFVCKSYHHEYIDKLVLSDHLAGYYIGQYVPLMSKDAQLAALGP